MKKITSITGKKIPIVWKDFDFTQSAVREVFYGLLSAFGVSTADSFIISGCTVSVNALQYTVAAGWISLDGEILQVDAHVTTITSGQVAYWSVEETNDPLGYKDDGEGNNYHTYKERKAKLSGGTPSTYLAHNCATLQDKIINLSARDLARKNTSAGGTLVGVTNGWANAGSSVGYTATYALDQFGYLEIRGAIVPTNAYNDVAFVLPSGFRPVISQANYYGRVEGISTGVSKQCVLESNGNFRIKSFDTNETGYYIHLRIKLQY